MSSQSSLGSVARVRDKHWKDEQFWGPGAPQNLNPEQARWYDLYQRSEAYREGRTELATVIVALSMRSPTTPNGEKPMEVYQLDPKQQFVPWSELQINLLYHINRRSLLDRLKRERLHFVGLFGQVDESQLVTVDASACTYQHDLYKAPVREHQLYDTVSDDQADLFAPMDGKFLVVRSALHCDLCLDDVVLYRFPADQESSVEILVNSGTVVRDQQLLARIVSPVTFALARCDSDGYWEMDYGGGDLVRAYDANVLHLANTMWEMQLDAADGLCTPLAPSLVLPRSYHAVPDGVRVRVNRRSAALVEEFCRAIGPGAAGDAAYHVVSPFSGEVTAIEAKESYPVNPANTAEGTMTFYSIKIGDRYLPGRLPGSAMLYVQVGDRVKQGDVLADPMRRDYYESMVDVEAVVPGNLADWLIRDFAERYRVDQGGKTLWPTHLLMQETIQQSQAVADLRPSLPHLRADGTVLLALPRANLDVEDIGSWSLRPHESLTNARYAASRS